MMPRSRRKCWRPDLPEEELEAIEAAAKKAVEGSPPLPAAVIALAITHLAPKIHANLRAESAGRTRDNAKTRKRTA